MVVSEVNWAVLIARGTQLTRSDAKRLLRRVINYPFFVPDLGTDVIAPLVAGNIEGFVAELERRSALGARPARALLAFLHLKGGLPDSHAHTAEKLCREVAAAGDPYAQYVMAWVSYSLDRHVEGMSWLRKSASQGLFPPAMVDLGRFVANGIGVEAPDVRAAIEILRDAHRLGHRMALLYIAQFLQKGEGGWAARILGVLLVPFAYMRATLYARRNPLSELAFVILATMKQPLFKQQHR